MDEMLARHLESVNSKTPLSPAHDDACKKASAVAAIMQADSLDRIAGAMEFICDVLSTAGEDRPAQDAGDDSEEE